MTLVVYWYDSVCFAIVGVAIVAAIWVIWRREGARKLEDPTLYESLLVTRPDTDEFDSARPSGYVNFNHLWTSCWRGLNPFWLLGIRFLCCVSLIGFLTWDMINWTPSIFIYYTDMSCSTPVWTFTLCIVYFAVATVVSAHGCWEYLNKPSNVRRDVEESMSTTDNTTYHAAEYKHNVKLQSHYDQEKNQQKAGCCGYLMQILYQMCGGAVFLTDIVFWCVILPFLQIAHYNLTVLMGCMHSVNLVCLLIEASINNLVSTTSTNHFLGSGWHILCCGALPMSSTNGLSMPAEPKSKRWPYPFLELSTAWAPLWYFCLAVIHLPCYGACVLLVKMKDKYFPKWFPHSFVASC
ncbi:hypothetical protein RJ641_030660 [Dillenia turbinata]|uniref:Uncharacterized protein n=1 Tax=Dillenia turbinata TaxID=194707 RepID=A0AAN8ZHA8_9MAGN